MLPPVGVGGGGASGEAEVAAAVRGELRTAINVAELSAIKPIFFSACFRVIPCDRDELDFFYS